MEDVYGGRVWRTCMQSVYGVGVCRRCTTNMLVVKEHTIYISMTTAHCPVHPIHLFSMMMRSVLVCRPSKALQLAAHQHHTSTNTAHCPHPPTIYTSSA